MSSSRQVQELAINSNTAVECGVLSKTPGRLQLAATWYFSPVASNASWLRVLEVDQTNVVKYGDEFHAPRRKQKFHSEKVSQDMFQLHILNVEDGDQGRYRCAVQEWLLSANGTGYKLGEETSGVTELKLRPTGKRASILMRLSVGLPPSLRQLFFVIDHMKVKIGPRVLGIMSFMMTVGPRNPPEGGVGHLR